MFRAGGFGARLSSWLGLRKRFIGWDQVGEYRERNTHRVMDTMTDGRTADCGETSIIVLRDSIPDRHRD